VDVYEPGSTFKIFTTAAALEYGVAHDNKTYFCPGYRIVDGQRIRCWRSIGHGSQHLQQGVNNSCNCVFMDMALGLGTERLYKTLRDFGFGSKSGVDFFGESGGLMLAEKNVKNIDLARIGFGHAIAVTPLQLAVAACAAVNGGVLYQPYFVKSAADRAAGTEYYRREPIKVRQVISEATSIKLRALLAEAVNSGSGKKARVDGFLVGGKTGTAQKYLPGGGIAQGKYVSSFLGFAPADDPRYVILTIVDEPSSYLYYGSLVAAPATGQVFKKTFDYLGMRPTLPPSTATVVMPELTGIDLRTAVKLLEDMGLYVETAGEGEYVFATVPVAMTVVPAGDSVLVRTD
ncbi:MAG: penicillin-binding transpeptidase domain-containing protein, partial [Firmicutes bacterium]|nr:penicillin-binding transpeptidase domain-containing protein [Bacillota bacterium]